MTIRLKRFAWHITLFTPLDPAEVEARLKQHTREPGVFKRFGHGVPDLPPAPVFEGHVDEGHFKLGVIITMPRDQVAPSGPALTGEIITVAGGSQIRVGVPVVASSTGALVFAALVAWIFYVKLDRSPLPGVDHLIAFAAVLVVGGIMVANIFSSKASFVNELRKIIEIQDTPPS